MLRSGIGLSLVLLCVPQVRAGDLPKGPPPRVMTAQVDKEGKPFLTGYVAETREEKVTYKGVVNGRPENLVKTVTVSVMVPRVVYLADAGVEVFGTDGKRVDAKNLKFRGPVGVFVSADGRPVDPVYLRLVRPGTLIVVGRALVVPGGYVTPQPAPGDGPRPD